LAISSLPGPVYLCKIPLTVKYTHGFCGRTPDFGNFVTVKESISHALLRASSSSVPSPSAICCTLEDGRGFEGLWFSKLGDRNLSSGLHANCWKK